MQAHLSSYGITQRFGDGNFVPISREIPIYEDYEPCWLEHLTLGSNCDVVAIKLTRPADVPQFIHHPANKISKIRVPVAPGETAFVIGFPQSLSVGWGLPIWKSGFIASEPAYPVRLQGQIADIGGLQGGHLLPAFFLDVATREGMSGSPVFAKFDGTWDTESPYTPIDAESPTFWEGNSIAMGARGVEFVGCYSARIRGSEGDAALGLCWMKETIETICREGVRGAHPQFLPAV